MKRVVQRSRGGFTLLEIVVALAIFAVTLGATAQGLAYAYGLVNLQNQRVTANNDCRAVISGLRQAVAASIVTSSNEPPLTPFPLVLFNWVNTFPENATDVAALPTAAQVPFAGMYSLQNETIAITLTNAAGNAAENTTNPVHVAVTVQWTGPRGITYTESVHTAITDR